MIEVILLLFLPLVLLALIIILPNLISKKSESHFIIYNENYNFLEIIADNLLSPAKIKNNTEVLEYLADKDIEYCNETTNNYDKLDKFVVIGDNKLESQKITVNSNFTAAIIVTKNKLIIKADSIASNFIKAKNIELIYKNHLSIAQIDNGNIFVAKERENQSLIETKKEMVILHKEYNKMITDHKINSSFLGNKILFKQNKINKNSVIYNNLIIRSKDLFTIEDSVTIYGDIKIYGKTKIGNNCKIYGNLIVENDLEIANNFVIKGNLVCAKNIYFYGNIVIGSFVYDNDNFYGLVAKNIYLDKAIMINGYAKFLR